VPEYGSHDIAAKLLAEPFERSGPAVQSLSDPIADTPMVVTLDQLRPYDNNLRLTRNPRYDELKSSISARGLDFPPPITRRPAESHYIIRNGGNTRLQILNDLWKETKDERFYRISSLFRPWSPRGEIVLLTGHLAENELHGGLSFIERSLGIEKARELYEQEAHESLTQTELARRLTADGYPITQSHISRMQDAVRHLLPAIPSILYGGLGRPQIERLTALRKAAARTWERHSKEKSLSAEFPELFHDVLASFDAEPDEFSVQRAQDELIGHMAELLGADYDALALEMLDADLRQDVLSRRPAAEGTGESTDTVAERSGAGATPAPPTPSSARASAPQPGPRTPSPERPTSSVETPRSPRPDPPRIKEDDSQNAGWHERLQGHIISPADTTDRLQAIQRTIADATGEPTQDFQRNVVEAIPVQAGGLHPISDVWYIEPALDTPDRLRAHVAQLAGEIANEALLEHRIEPTEDGLGFSCIAPAPREKPSTDAFFSRAVLTLLSVLSCGHAQSRPTIDCVRLADDLGPLLQGTLPSPRSSGTTQRLSDASIVKLFRLIRLARRLVDLESTVPQKPDDSSDS
jgi:ParB family protein of integrating conjugative element (PFGI_1 class)